MLDNFTAVFMPYCLEQQPDGKYAVLNREYKPVGFNTCEWIDYDEYPVCVKLKGVDPAKAMKLSCKGSENTEHIQLYNDSCNPHDGAGELSAYLERLGLLMKLKVA